MKETTTQLIYIIIFTLCSIIATGVRIHKIIYNIRQYYAISLRARLFDLIGHFIMIAMILEYKILIEQLFPYIQFL